MYREVTMVELKEVLALWRERVPTKRIAAQLGLDPKTVRRYRDAADAAGLRADGGAVSDDQLRDVLLALHPAGGRPRGDGWTQCAAQREPIRRWLGDGLRLTKIRKLLARQGVVIAYPTLYRFAVLELQFGRTATTIPVLDGAPGQELQVDTGWVGWLTLPQRGTRRRFRAWIFTAVRSRHRFVYPTFEETTARAIEACEAAWAFFGGIFAVLIPDNTEAIITLADPLAPRIAPAFLEYAQARHFHIDAARVRHPRDKGRVERASRVSATIALPANSSPRWTTPARSPRAGASRSMASVGTVARSGVRSSTSRRKSTRCSCRPRRRPTTSRSGTRRRSPAISWPASPRRSTRFRIRTSAASSPRGRISTSSASMTAAG